MHICLLVATKRGRRFLECVHDLIPSASLTVVTFRENEDEPAFFDDIKHFCEQVRAKVFVAKQVGLDKYQSFWDELMPIDAMFVVSWRYMIPQTVYSRPLRGTFVFHDSLLPSYRGFAPTVWAIVNGESQTGVTLMQIARDVDAGDIVDQCVIPIHADATIASIMEEVTSKYLEVLKRNIFLILEGRHTSIVQDHSLATYTAKRCKQDYKIDWSKSARSIYNLIRGCTRPYPGAFTYLEGDPMIIWSANLNDNRKYVSDAPGRVGAIGEVDGVHGVSIICGDRRVIFLTSIQKGQQDVIEGVAFKNYFKFSTTLGNKEV